MKVLLDIKDDKAPALLEVLKGLSYVKTEKIISAEKSALIEDLKESIKEVKLAKEGKIKLKTLDELLDEL